MCRYLILTGVIYINPIKKLTTAISSEHCHCPKLGNRSRMAVTEQEVMAIFDPMPNTKSMRKNSTEKICGRFLNLAMASGYEMKANPAPPFTTEPMSSVPISWARCPRIPNIVNPASREVIVSRPVTIAASLCTLCPNLLNEEYMMMLPKQTDRE